MATPTLLSVSNVALPSSADSGDINVTAPTGANACVIGGTGYLSDDNVPTSLTGSQLSAVNLLARNGSGGSFMTAWAAHAKVLATGGQTIRLQKTGSWVEGPTCQIFWLTVDNPDDFVRAWANTGTNSNFAPGATYSPLSVTIASATTDLVVGMFGKDANDTLSAPSGTTQQGTTQTNNSDQSLLFKVTSPGASTTTVTTASIAFPTLFAIALKEGGGSTSHAASGTLTGQGSSLAGSAARARAHASSGVLAGPGSTVYGSGSHNVPHAASGVLTGQGAAVVGAANRTRQHASTGDLQGQGAAIAGAGARTRQHASSGVLLGPGSEVAGVAERARAHGSSGSLAGPGSEVVGAADHQSPAGTHDATGALVGQGSAVAGSAARLRAFGSSGALVGPGATVVGVASRSSGPIAHDATGVLIGPGSAIAGLAMASGDPVELLGGGPGGPGGPRKKHKRRDELDKDSYLYRLLSPDVRECIEPQAAEVIEAKAVEVVEVKAKPSPKAVRVALADEGLAYRQAYKEIYLELIGAIRKAKADEEEEEEAIAMALIL